MKLIIAIRGVVDDEAEAQTILQAVAASLESFTEDDLQITTSVSLDIELPLQI